MPGHAGSSFGRSIFLFRYCSLRSLFSLVHLSLFVFSFITLCFHQISKHTTVNKVFYNLRRIRTKSFHWQAMMKFLAIHQFELLTWLSFPNLLLVVIQNIKKTVFTAHFGLRCPLDTIEATCQGRRFPQRLIFYANYDYRVIRHGNVG